jgi:mevalonate kinase
MPSAAYSGFGAGKIILLGEHAVVYGYPALAGPLSWGVTATASVSPRCSLRLPAGWAGAAKKSVEAAFLRAAAKCAKPRIEVSVESDLPLSMGLGSSAALSVACAQVLLQASGKRPTVPAVMAVALEMERAFHGTPSGVDQTCSATGALIRYQRRGRAVLGGYRVVRCGRPLKVLVALAGQRRPTRETVAGLRDRLGRWPRRYRRLLADVGGLADEGARAVTSGDLQALGDAMNVNHGLLSALGVSSPALDTLVHELRNLGALGAKLTGAGGDGGAVVGLFLEPEAAVARLTRLGVRCFASHIAGPPAL